MTILQLCPQRMRDLEPLPDDVVLVNLRAMTVWLRSGEEVTVRNLFVGQVEVDPDDTDKELTALVAGPMNSGEWLTVDLSGYEPVET